jgi:hypothetical protein
MSDAIKGRFVFIPEDGGEAYEIDLDAVLEEAATEISDPWWKKVATFLQSFKKEKEEAKKEKTLDLPLVKSINIPELVCAKLEELFSTAEWHHRDEFETSTACYVLDVTPSMHAKGYEPMVTLTLPNGTVQDIPLADLLTHYVPYEPQGKGERYEH